MFFGRRLNMPKLKNVKRMMDKKLWNLSDLEKATGLSWQTCRSAAAGKNVSTTSAKKISIALDATPKDFGL